jgi:CHRD domain
MRPRLSWRLALVVLLAVLAAAVVRVIAKSEGGAVASTTSSRPASAASACRSDPHRGVHDPRRLRVLDRCATFVGTVVAGPKLNASDGDVTFTATPDEGYASMLNGMNRREGGLHVEIVPTDQPGCKRGEPIEGAVKKPGVCSGAQVLYPPLRARVRVIGAYVYNARTRRNEIHPTWSVEMLPPTRPPPPETEQLEARLTGEAVGKNGTSQGSGRVVITLVGQRLCWRFTLAGIGTPTGATLRTRPPKAGRVILALGTPYRAQGCVTADAAPLLVKPRHFYVTVVTARHQFGVLSGQLEPIAD